jgi:hypothetical protein
MEPARGASGSSFGAVHPDYSVGGMSLISVYRLRDDTKRIQSIQTATLETAGYGLVPQPALLGSSQWWQAIDEGRLPLQIARGTITRVFWSSMGDWPSFELTTSSGDVLGWTRDGDITKYVEGLEVQVTYVVQRHKPSAPILSDKRADIVIEIMVEESPLRSRGFGPGVHWRPDRTELFRPVGRTELELIAASNYKLFPPRLPEQPIFYPVIEYEYAAQIARDWNSKDPRSGHVGYVTRFFVPTEYLAHHEVHQVGGRQHKEYWIPADELSMFNSNIVSPIEVVAIFENTVQLPTKRRPI